MIPFSSSDTYLKAFAIGAMNTVKVSFIGIIFTVNIGVFVGMARLSSNAVAIGYPDFVSISNTTICQTGQAIEGVALIMVLYLTISLLTSLFMNWYNSRIALVER
ncbi:MAG: hypothetical protein U9P10_08270 [Thermodesulfobacteriota bacterium]|nr:hypothetical protein [Thermodesulfobacteriota bacterium]